MKRNQKAEKPKREREKIELGKRKLITEKEKE